MKIKFKQLHKNAIAPEEVLPGVFAIKSFQDASYVQPVDGALSLMYSCGYSFEVENGHAVLYPINTGILQGSTTFGKSGEVALVFEIKSKHLQNAFPRKGDVVALLSLYDEVKVDSEFESIPESESESTSEVSSEVQQGSN